jgi:hypothetical protein
VSGERVNYEPPGKVSGGANAAEIQGEPVDPTPPAEGDVLEFIEGMWRPVSPPTRKRSIVLAQLQGDPYQPNLYRGVWYPQNFVGLGQINQSEPYDFYCRPYVALVDEILDDFEVNQKLPAGSDITLTLCVGDPGVPSSFIPSGVSILLLAGATSATASGPLTLPAGQGVIILNDSVSVGWTPDQIQINATAKSI